LVEASFTAGLAAAVADVVGAALLLVGASVVGDEAEDLLLLPQAASAKAATAIEASARTWD
jgi:hypothetical protein